LLRKENILEVKEYKIQRELSDEENEKNPSYKSMVFEDYRSSEEEK
jgi:hypothetical protein